MVLPQSQDAKEEGAIAPSCPEPTGLLRPHLESARVTANLKTAFGTPWRSDRGVFAHVQP